VPVPEWGRILLGGVGCFLLAWAGFGLATELNVPPLWLADAMLIFMVLGRSGGMLAATLLAGAIGIFIGHLPTGATAMAGVTHALAALSEALLARWALAHFAPAATRPETAGALVRLLLWGAALPAIAGALPIAIGAIAAGSPESATATFGNWWCAMALGSAVLLPPLLALDNPALRDPKLLRSRWREALCVVVLVLLIALVLHQEKTGLPLFLGLPLVMWAGLRFDFRTTSILCLMVALIGVLAVRSDLWPLYWDSTDDGVVRTLQAYLVTVVLPALFGSLLTQQQRATNAARLTALQALHAVMDAVPLAIVAAAPDGKVSLWSRGAERIFGWRRAEVEGGKLPFLAPEHAAQDASLRQRVLAGNEIQNHPAQRRGRAGELRELVINAMPQRDADGTITGIINVMEDVTDRRRLEASREEHRAQLAAILDAVADAIITSDEQGTITSFSRAAETVFGFAASEVMGRNLSMLMPEPDHSRHDGYLRRYRETGEAHIIGTNRRVTARHKDGSTFPAEITVSEAWLDGSRIFAGIVRDLSLKPSAVAPQAVQHSGVDAAKFLSRITHDLRQPLHALSLMTGALERRVVDPEARELVDHISQAVRSTQGMFENIVEWTRLEGGIVATAPRAIAADEILASLVQEFEEEARRRNLALRYVPSCAIIAGDPALVRRILKQLLDNAVKYTAGGKVLVGARRQGALLRLIVADTGNGIPADQQDFIFGEFQQLDAGREAGGLGLGLAIARRLAALADLKIGVRSIPGEGSQFWIDVPLAAA
jgi:PAS domain S-box-containing protein